MRLAARGTRDMDGGVEGVADPDEARWLRVQAVRVYIESTVLAGLLAGLAVLAAAWAA